MFGFAAIPTPGSPTYGWMSLNTRRGGELCIVTAQDFWDTPEPEKDALWYFFADGIRALEETLYELGR